MITSLILRQKVFRSWNLRPGLSGALFIFYVGKGLGEIKKRERRADKGAQIIIIDEK